ncbi:hypothetical protein [Bradyrhizobium sp. SRS-191]|uniref:hypothetical protein n=1 Tax=Bradyrhizobium sp. SRS-191 TaxID=2962606 RepID=UPI00211E7E39|nr:hypothetical protein [Bradyrhizobium sp. SRS-191]
MSYSFNVSASTKSDAKTAVAAKVDEMIVSQPIHARDKQAILANASAVIDLLSDTVPEDHYVAVSCSGYVSWTDVALKSDGSNAAEIPLKTASISAVASYFKPVV